jgi:hypothetical protein
MKSFYTLLFLLIPFVGFAQMDIATARQQAENSEVTVTGVVTNGDEIGSPIRYIEDGTAGIAIYDPENTEGVNRGDSITVTGILLDYNGLLEIYPVNNLINHGSGYSITPQFITPDDIGESTESELVSIENVIFENAGQYFSVGFYNFNVGDQSGVIYVKADCDIENTLIPSCPVKMTAISSQYSFTGFDGYQLLVRDENDFEFSGGICYNSPLTQSDITTSSFIINFSTNYNALSELSYGLTTNLELGVVYSDSFAVQNHAISLDNLEAGSIYYVQALAYEGSDSTYSAVYAFATQSTSVEPTYDCGDNFPEFPDSTFSFYPDTAQNLDTAFIGQYFEEYLLFLTPTNLGDILGYPYLFNVLGIEFDISSTSLDSISFISIIGLPDSFNYEFSNSDGIYYQNNLGCIKIFGTPENDDVGNYDLTILINGWISVGALGTVSLYDELGDYDSIDGYNLIISQSSGCTDLNACNYNSNAYTDDGSCLYSTSNEETNSACNEFNWNGELYTQSGEYTYVTSGSNGCDSITTLNLTITNSINVNLDITSCDEYSWQGEVYTESGTYTYETVNENGCDSVVNLNLSIVGGLESQTIIGQDEVEPFSSHIYALTLNENIYGWSVTNGNILSDNGNNIEVLWGEAGIGLIEVVETDENGCTITHSLQVNLGNNVENSWNCVNDACVDPLDGSGEYGSLNDCEANCTIVIEDSWNCVNDACVDPMDGSGVYSSLNDCEQECQNVSSINENIIDVNIYPNPSSNIFNLEFNSNYETEITVTNILGEQVYFESTNSIGEFNTQIDLSDYSKGIYNLTIKTSDGLSNHKLILQ